MKRENGPINHDSAFYFQEFFVQVLSSSGWEFIPEKSDLAGNSFLLTGTWVREIEGQRKEIRMEKGIATFSDIFHADEYLFVAGNHDLRGDEIQNQNYHDFAYLTSLIMMSPIEMPNIFHYHPLSPVRFGVFGHRHEISKNPQRPEEDKKNG
jgi:hypothetical protein